MKHILPDAMLGIIGGGQLGRMFTMAARAMGYRVTVLEPDRDSPAGVLPTFISVRLTTIRVHWTNWPRAVSRLRLNLRMCPPVV